MAELLAFLLKLVAALQRRDAMCAKMYFCSILLCSGRLADSTLITVITF